MKKLATILIYTYAIVLAIILGTLIAGVFINLLK